MLIQNFQTPPPYFQFTMAMAAAAAVAAAAVIRPEDAEGGRNHENRFFIEKRCFRPILVIL